MKKRHHFAMASLECASFLPFFMFTNKAPIFTGQYHPVVKDFYPNENAVNAAYFHNGCRTITNNNKFQCNDVKEELFDVRL